MKGATAPVRKRRPRKPGVKPAKSGPAKLKIWAWEDDPGSGAPPIKRPVPRFSRRLPLEIVGPVAPKPMVYASGTRGFRYWTAADALVRATEFWASILEDGVSWYKRGPLQVGLDQGAQMNAYYNRDGLWFFHARVAGRTIYSAESPDIICHEVGHAVLDAVRPELWDMMSVEAAAIHESFGDLSAIFVGLQLPSLARSVLAETGGRLYRSSRVSRIAEQFGRGIRQIRPDGADRDCLRNAVNSFVYRSPETLPASAPASSLSASPHSFSRVFTAACFEALAGMLDLHGPASDGQLQSTAADGARLLVHAIASAPIVPDYYSQVAAHVIEADNLLFGGRYYEALKNAFVRRGILSFASTAILASELPRLRRTAALALRDIIGTVRATLVERLLGAEEFGFRKPFRVTVPSEPRRFSVAATGKAGRQPAEGEGAAKVFIRNLFQRSRIALPKGSPAAASVVDALSTKTHQLLEVPDACLIRRIRFDSFAQDPRPVTGA
jgi:hypothetical protein